MNNINWLATGAVLLKIGLGAFLISQGQVATGVGLIAAAVGINAMSPGLLPTSK